MGPESQGGYLEKGDFEINVGYRHQFSYKHFVGDVEQTYRVQQDNQVMNKVNLENVNVLYQLHHFVGNRRQQHPGARLDLESEEGTQL